MGDRSLRLEILIAGIDRATRPMLAVKRGAGDMAKGLKEARDRLRQLEATQRDTEGFRKLEGDIVTTTLELRKARQAAAELQAKFQAAEEPTKRLANQFTRAREAVAKLEAQQRSETTRLSELKTKLESAGVSTGDMARHQDRLQHEIREANGAIDAQKRKLTELTERQKRASKAADIIQTGGGRAGKALAVSAAAGATAAAIAVPLKAEYELGNDFESRMTDLRQKAGLDRTQGEALGLKLRADGVAVNQLPEEMQKAADSLAGMGLDVPVAVRLTQPMGKTATTYKAEMEDLAKTSFAVIDNLKVSADPKEMTRVYDALAFAGKEGAFELKDMASVFPSLTASYQALGQKGVGAAADLAASLQIVRKGAGDSETAGTNLANVLQKIASPETEKKFSKMGVNLRNELKKAAEAGKTPIEAIAEITNRALGGDDKKVGDLSKLGYLFEDAQVQQGLRPLIQNLEELRRIRSGAMNAGGTVDKDFADRMKDNAEASKAMSIALMDVKLTIAAQLAPVITPLANKVAAAARNFQAWTKEHPKFTAFMAKGAVWVGIFMAAIAAIAFVVAPILAFISALGAAAFFLGTTIGGLVATIAAFIAVVAAVVIAVIGLIKGWDKLAPLAAAAWRAVVDKVRGAVAWVLALGVNFYQAGVNLMQGLVGGIMAGLGKVKDAITGAGAKVVAWFKSKLGIHSPSRVFAGLGGHIMEGLDQGIDRGSGRAIARVRQVAAGMTAAMAVSAPAIAATPPALVEGPTSQRLELIRTAEERLAAPKDALARAADRPALTGIADSAPALRRPAGAAGQGAVLSGPIKVEIHIHAAPGMDTDELVEKAAAKVTEALNGMAPPTSGTSNTAYGDDYV